MSARKATKTTLGVTVYVLIVLAIIAVVGLIPSPFGLMIHISTQLKKQPKCIRI